MLLFGFALVVALLGVGAYDVYNPGTRAITMAGYHFAAVPVWIPVGLAAAAPLSLFLLHALWAGVRIWMLKRALRRVPEWELVEPRPAVEWSVPPPAAERFIAPAPVVRRRRRSTQAPPTRVGPQPAPKRSWLTPPD